MSRLSGKRWRIVIDAKNEQETHAAALAARVAATGSDPIGASLVVWGPLCDQEWLDDNYDRRDCEKFKHHSGRHGLMEGLEQDEE